MAFHDWNHDGEKDWKDNAIEYQLLKNMNKDEKPGYTPRSSSGMSGCGALVATIATIIISAALISFFFGGDVSDVPGWLLLVIFIIVASAISALFGSK